MQDGSRWRKTSVWPPKVFTSRLSIVTVAAWLIDNPQTRCCMLKTAGERHRSRGHHQVDSEGKKKVVVTWWMFIPTKDIAKHTKLCIDSSKLHSILE